MIGRSWLEISIKTIVQNYHICKSLLPNSIEVMSVIKADAYGHGDMQVGKALQDAGCQSFAVSNLMEALRLRDAGVTGQILILGYTPAENWSELVQHQITQALLSEEYAQALAGHQIMAQFAIDTGMNRIGLDGDDPAACETIIRHYANSFRLTGIFTHPSIADCEEGREFTLQQMAKFKAVADRIADMKLPYLHCLNSAASIWHEPYGNLSRLGIVLYGLKPDDSLTLPKGIRAALTWKTVISMIKTVHSGEFIGYGCAYHAKKELRVATLPTGYADGYSRALSDRGHVIIHGKTAPILGRICMDQMMVDVTEIPQAAFGDEVILCNEDYTPDDMAKTIGTIGYELICGISKRVPRVYIDE